MKRKRDPLVKLDGQATRTASHFGATKKKPPEQIGDSPEWLPSGWKLEITTRRRGATAGRSCKRYFDPFTGSRFYSKREVFRYLESGEPNRKRSVKTNAAGDICTSSNQRGITDNKLTDNLVKPDGQATRTTSDFRATKKKPPLQICESPEWLPSGWKLEFITRRSGASAGQIDKRYFDPLTGSRFYSKREVFRYLESGEPNRKKRVKTNAAGDICTSSDQRGITDNKLTDNLVKPDGQATRTTSDFRVTKKKPPLQIGDSPEWLPSGWKLEITTRQSGASAGQICKRYIDPLTGSRFYSKREVFRYLESGEPKRKKSVKTNATGDICTSSDQRGITDNKLTDNLVRPDGQATRTTSDFRVTKKKPPLQIGDSPEWLPSGWKLEITTRQSGATAGQIYKRYFDPFTGSRFYSKREVFRYLESREPNQKRSVKMNATGDICTSSKQRGITDNKLTDNVLECSPDGLPDGWIKVIKTKKANTKQVRKASTKQGVRKYQYYIDPVSGYAFQSRKDAYRYIETGEISKYAFRPNKRHTSNMYSIGKEGTPPIAAKRSTTRGNDIRRCLFSAQARNSKVKMMIAHPSAQDDKGADSALKGEHLGNETENLHDAAFHGGVFSPSVTKKCEGRKKCASEEPQNQRSALQVRPKKTKAFKTITLPLRSSRRLAGIKADPVIDSGISDLPLRIVTDKSEQHTATPAQGCSLSSRKSDRLKSTTTAGLDFLAKSEGEHMGSEMGNLHDAASQEIIFPQCARKKHQGRKCGSKEQVGSQKQGSAVQLCPKRTKAFKAITLPNRSSKRLSGIKAVSVVDSGISDRRSRIVANRFEQPTVTPSNGSSGKSDVPKATTTDLEFIEKSEGENPGGLPVAPMHGSDCSSVKSDGPKTAPKINLEFLEKSDGEDPEKLFLTQMQGCDSSSKKSDEPITPPTIDLEFLKKSDGEKLPIEQISLGKQVGETISTADKLESPLILPFGDSWPDPCIEFAFKTLTGDIPVFEDTTTIEEYFQRQLIPAPGPSLSGSVSVSFSSAVNYTQPEPGDQHPVQEGGACSTLESRFQSGREAKSKCR